MASPEIPQEKEDKLGKFVHWLVILAVAGIVIGVALHAVNLEIAAKT